MLCHYVVGERTMERQTLFVVEVRVLEPRFELFAFCRKFDGYCFRPPAGAKCYIGGLPMKVIECYVHTGKDSTVSVIALDYGIVPDMQTFESVKDKLEVLGFVLLEREDQLPKLFGGG